MFDFITEDSLLFKLLKILNKELVLGEEELLQGRLFVEIS
jgi:hypothetical protein